MAGTSLKLETYLEEFDCYYENQAINKKEGIVIMGRQLMALLLLALLAACGVDNGTGTSGLGESCTRTFDCETGLKCVDLECVIDYSSADGDTQQPDDVEGVWYDAATELSWQNPIGEDQVIWEKAVDYCATLNLAGKQWRLPNVKELRSLIRDCPTTETGGSCMISDTCLDSTCHTDSACERCSFLDGPGGDFGCYWPSELEGLCLYYWSSSRISDNNDFAWYINFSSAFIHWSVVGYPDYEEDTGILTRCVAN